MKKWIAAGVVLAIVIAGLVLWPKAPQRFLSAIFPSAVGIHAGSGVRVLGVKIGEVTLVKPQGRTVLVQMRYDSNVLVPAGAAAVIVPPSVVADRYIQLAPAYNGGEALADGARLPIDKTVVPIELDEIYAALDKLNVALGPSGANQNGALADLVHVGAANLAGNGQNLHDTLDGLSRALTALSEGREDLFGTIDNLAVFTAMLKQSDAVVREFNGRMAEVSEQLAAEGDELASAVRNLARALADITTFVKANREELKQNVAALADLAGILVKQQRSLIEVLDVAPLALSNLNLAYNPASGTTDTRDNAMGPYDPAQFVCKLLADTLPVAQLPAVCGVLPQ
jgi:virulence factor Mce-like protein